MATEPTPTTTPDSNEALIKGLMAAFAAQGSAQGEAIAAAIAATQPPRQLTPAQYDPKTKAHPNKHTAARLTRPTRQNGIACDWDVTSDDEIRYLNRLTHSGWYLDGLVEVLIERRGQDEIVDVRFQNKTVAQQLALAHKCTGFADMLRQIVKVQEEEDLDEATRPEPKRRPFGNSRATQEARERAGVA